jgi:IMP cyclohydrolase
MTKGLEAISGEYHGGIIILGRAESGENVVAYAVTSRSPSSRARKFELEGEAIKTAPTNLQDLNTGNPALLIYPAITNEGRGSENFVVVSNGAQTGLIADALRNYNIPFHSRFGDEAYDLPAILSNAFQHPNIIGGIDITRFEPDAPNFTPRISGILARNKAVLSIIRHEPEDNVSRSVFKFPLLKGYGKAISTYTGQNVPKGEVIPSFRGEPLTVELNGRSSKEIADRIYETLGPKAAGPGIISPGDDFRVGVAVAFHDPITNKRISYSILNRIDIEKT